MTEYQKYEHWSQLFAEFKWEEITVVLFGVGASALFESGALADVRIVEINPQRCRGLIDSFIPGRPIPCAFIYAIGISYIVSNSPADLKSCLEQARDDLKRARGPGKGHG